MPTINKKDSSIETSRLRIVPMSDEHVTLCYVRWLNDPEVVKYSEQRHRTHTLESCREYARSFKNTQHYMWAVILKGGSGEHIGNMNAYLDLPNRVADVGILIGERSHWHCGYGLEAWNAVCQYLLRIAGVRKITAGTMAKNRGMLSIMQKSGMMEDGRKIRQYICDGEEVDVVHYALFEK